MKAISFYQRALFLICPLAGLMMNSSPVQGAVLRGVDNNGDEGSMMTVPSDRDLISSNETNTNTTTLFATNYTTCAEADCNSHPETGFYVFYTTCEEIDGQAYCGCQYGDKFGDVYPGCLGDTHDCESGFWADRCVDSFCNNWCDTIPTDFCEAGTDEGECCQASGCEYLVCNPDWRQNGPEPQCTCSEGTMYHIDLTDSGAQYTPASGCTT